MSRKRNRQRGHAAKQKQLARATVAQPQVTSSSPPQNSASVIDWRAHLPHAGIVAIALFILYAATMPHLVTFEDSGIFNLACYTGGVAHPPGYPLYSLLCYPFAHLPFVSTATGINLMSALFGALSCALLYYIAVTLLNKNAYGYIAALSFGICGIFWSQAIVQEVYTLHTFLLFALLLLALIYRRQPNEKILYAIAFVYGLSLSNHWPLMGVVTPALIVLLLPALTRLKLHTPFYFAGLLALGVTPYFYVVITSNSDALFNFLGPIESVQQFSEFLGRVGFSKMDDQGGDWGDRFLFAKLLLTDAKLQYGIPALPLIVIGFIRQWRTWGWAVAAAVTWIYLTVYALVVMLGFDFYKPLSQETFLVYASPAYTAFGLWLAAGVAAMYEWLQGKVGGGRLPVIATATVTVLVLAIQFYGNTSTARSNDKLAHTYASTVLNGLEQNATLIINTAYSLPFLSAGPVDGIRPDVTVFHSNGIFLNNRFVSARSSPTTKTNATRAFINSSRTPLYYLGRQPHDFGIEDFGIYKKVRRDLPAGQQVTNFPPGGLALVEETRTVTTDSPSWNISFKSFLLRAMARLVMAIGIDAEQSQPYIAALEKDYLGNLALAAELAQKTIASNAQRGLDFLAQAERMLPKDAPVRNRAQIYFYRGVFLSWNSADLSEVEKNLVLATEIDPSPTNIAHEKIKQLRKAMKSQK